MIPSFIWASPSFRSSDLLKKVSTQNIMLLSALVARPPLSCTAVGCQSENNCKIQQPPLPHERFRTRFGRRATIGTIQTAFAEYLNIGVGHSKWSIQMCSSRSQTIQSGPTGNCSPCTQANVSRQSWRSHRSLFPALCGPAIQGHSQRVP